MNDHSTSGAANAGGIDRRRVLGGIAMAGGALAAAPALASCTVPSEPSGGQPGTGAGDGAPAEGGQGTGAHESGSGSGKEPLARLSEVPSGGGVVLAGKKIVVTRDGDGKARAFSAVCTHQGCAVTSVQGGTINCPCHGSKFDAATGKPVAGPASKPLPSVAVEERDGAIYPV